MALLGTVVTLIVVFIGLGWLLWWIDTGLDRSHLRTKRLRAEHDSLAKENASLIAINGLLHDVIQLRRADFQRILDEDSAEVPFLTTSQREALETALARTYREEP